MSRVHSIAHSTACDSHVICNLEYVIGSPEIQHLQHLFSMSESRVLVLCATDQLTSTGTGKLCSIASEIEHS